jgi:hypothetical protein
VGLRTAERTGVLVVRAWFEVGAGGGLRARITGNIDIAERGETVTVASSPEGIAAAVLEWVDAFVASAAEVTGR